MSKHSRSAHNARQLHWARRTHQRIVWVLFWGILALALGACDEVDPAPSTSSTLGTDPTGGSGALLIPTRTVKPIVSFTPRFTATPIPSPTFTPSITPSPTETTIPPTSTATLTVTPTPTVSGVIQSIESRVNLRSGPSFDSDVVLSVPIGTRLGVIGAQQDDNGLDWYKVAYTDDDGEEFRLWVRSNLVVTDYDTIVVVLPTPTSTTAPGATASTPNTLPSRTPGATPLPERIDILAYCRQKNVLPPAATTNDDLYVEWSWFVAREDLMQPHLENANYEVRLDGELLEDWAQYATEMKREAGVWIIYWYYPVGRLRLGEHEVTYRLTWDAPINDGYADFGPGTANETDTGNCTFTVQAP